MSIALGLLAIDTVLHLPEDIGLSGKVDRGDHWTCIKTRCDTPDIELEPEMLRIGFFAPHGSQHLDALIRLEDLYDGSCQFERDCRSAMLFHVPP